MNESAKKQEQDNLRIWNGVKHVGPKLLKEIKGGNLKGYSDINPLWRVEQLTAVFGPVGFGWNVRETARWTDEYGGELMASVKVELTICMDGLWSQPIEGVGGSKLYGKGKGEGLNDEAWKMATTDAISVACKSLGFAADVYMGRQSHRDADQQGGGGDYGTKYEERNYARNSTRNTQTGGYTTQPVNGQNRAVSAPNWGEYGPGPVYAGNGAPYQAPPPGDPNYVQPSGQRNPHSKVCEVVDVQKGRAVRLINELAKYDYDDPQSWSAGLDWLRHEVVLRPGAEEAIVQLAIAKRNDNQSEAARRALS